MGVDDTDPAGTYVQGPLLPDVRDAIGLDHDLIAKEKPIGLDDDSVPDDVHVLPAHRVKGDTRRPRQRGLVRPTGRQVVFGRRDALLEGTRAGKRDGERAGRIDHGQGAGQLGIGTQHDAKTFRLADAYAALAHVLPSRPSPRGSSSADVAQTMDRENGMDTRREAPARLGGSYAALTEAYAYETRSAQRDANG